MTAQTPIYGITYPEGSDLVSDAPNQLETMAQTVENALHEVDQRATPEGSTPVIATTLETLQTLTAVAGQAGYVTGDGDDTGPYVYTGSEWRHVYTYTVEDTDLTYLVQNQSGWTVRYQVHHGFVWLRITLNGTGTGNWSDVTCPATLPEAVRPVTTYQIAPINTNNQSNGRFVVDTDGSIVYNKLGGSIINDDKSCTIVYPAK